MEHTDQLRNYLTLLAIRRKAYHRNAIITGSLLVLVFLATTTTLLFTAWNARSIWLIGIFDVLSLIGFLMAWVRYELITDHMQLLNDLQIQWK